MQYFRINSPNVVREFFDGEVVVVNLETGTYYSFEKLAAEIWRLFELGLSFSAVVGRLSDKHEKPEAECATLVTNFLHELRSKGLLLEENSPFVPPASHTEANQRAVDPAFDKSAAQALDNTSFEVPIVRPYSDMQDLLLLDPIHDVGSGGWPQPKT